MSRRQTAALAAALVLGLWWHSLDVFTAGLVYEDAAHLGKASGLSDIPTRYIHFPGRQLTFLSYTATQALGVPIHAGNLVLHTFAGGLVWTLTARLSPYALAPWIALVVFWFHPIQGEAVHYLSARSDVLATVFILSAVLTCLSRCRGWRVLTGLGLALACMSKELAVVGPALVAVATQAVSTRAARFAALAAVGIGVMVLLWPWSDITAGVLTDRPLDHLTSQALALWQFAWMFVSLDGFTVDHGFVTAATWRGGVALIGLVAALVLVWRWRSRWPLTACMVAWTAFWIGPRFVVSMPELISERHVYFPIAGWSIAIGNAIAWRAQALRLGITAPVG